MADIVSPPIKNVATKQQLIAVAIATLSALNEKVDKTDFLGVTKDIIDILKELTNSTSVISATGTSQTTSQPVTADLTAVTGGTGGILLQSIIGRKQEIFNRSGASINIYPPTGSSIETYAANIPIVLANGNHATFIGFTPTQFYQTV